MLRSWFLVGVLVGVTACAVTPEERTTEACTTLCACEVGPLPALQDRCVAKCSQDHSTPSISDQCLACISSNSDRCATLEQTCRPICDPPMPVPDGGTK